MKDQHLSTHLTKDLFLGLCLLAVFVALLTLRNSGQIISSLEESTSNYVSDVAMQMAEQVDARIETSLDTLQLIGDSAVLLTPDALDEFLQRKESLSHFDSLYLTDSAQTEQMLAQAEAAQCDIQTVHDRSATLIFDPQTGILTYLLPLNDQVAIVGTKTSRHLSDFLTSSFFGGYSFSILTSQDGTVIANPSGTTLME